jgi:hypothetical protein
VARGGNVYPREAREKVVGLRSSYARAGVVEEAPRGGPSKTGGGARGARGLGAKGVAVLTTLREEPDG